MKTAPSAEVKARFNEYIKSVQTEPVAITRDGKIVAALVALDDKEDLETFALGHSRRLREILAAGKEQFKQGKGIPHDQFWAEVQASYRKRAKPKAAKLRDSRAKNKRAV